MRDVPGWDSSGIDEGPFQVSPEFEREGRKNKEVKGGAITNLFGADGGAYLVAKMHRTWKKKMKE